MTLLARFHHRATATLLLLLGEDHAMFCRASSPHILLSTAVTLLACFLSGCSDGDVRSIYSIQGVGPPGNEAAIQGQMGVYVIGTGFGEEAGRLLAEGEEVAVSQWGPQRIRFRLSRENWASGQIKIVVGDPEGGNEIRGPVLLPDLAVDGTNPLHNAYREYIDAYAVENGLQNNPEYPGWADWMKSSESGAIESPLRVYSQAYQRQLIERKYIRISYNYLNDVPLELRRPWPLFERNDENEERWEAYQEMMHMFKVGELLSAAYPTYRFQVIFGLEKLEADVVVYANARRNQTEGPTGIGQHNSYTRIDITLDQNLPHELGHFLLGWYDHHCAALDCEAVPAGRNMPPTTLAEPQKCTMDRDGGYWCNACAAGLGIPVERVNHEQYREIRREFNGRYAANRP